MTETATAPSRRQLLLGTGALALGVTATFDSALALPARAAGGTSKIYNPFGAPAPWNWNWEQHVTNNSGRGGQDFPYSEGTPIASPGIGNLVHVGNVSGAGIVMHLNLDLPAQRMIAPGTNEGAGNMSTIVFQHLQANQWSPQGHYKAGDRLGQSGSTGGVPAHLHVHGLNASGQRVDFMKFLDPAYTNSSIVNAAAPGGTPGNPGDDMPSYELVRLPDQATVWYSVDRIHRYAVPDSATLTDYQYFIAAKGQPNGVTLIGNLNAFGTPVWQDGTSTHV